MAHIRYAINSITPTAYAPINEDTKAASRTTRLRSGHTGGVNAVFGDGSVRFLSTTPTSSPSRNSRPATTVKPPRCPKSGPHLANPPITPHPLWVGFFTTHIAGVPCAVAPYR